MGDYMADKGIEAGEVHPAYKAMNQLEYDAGNIGNNEFNYGLEFLAESITMRTSLTSVRTYSMLRQVNTTLSLTSLRLTLSKIRLALSTK